MQGTQSFIKVPKAQRIRSEQFDVKQERKTNERNRQQERADKRQQKYNPE